MEELCPRCGAQLSSKVIVLGDREDEPFLYCKRCGWDEIEYP